jgi:hypothetical protein
MSREDRLRNAIHDILIAEWDPLGVGAISDAQDEYDSYISEIYSILNSGADKVKLVGHLRELETVSMGLTWQDHERRNRVAESLLGLVE